MVEEPFLINPPKRIRRKRSRIPMKLKHWSFVSKRKRNPIGETLVTIGANPIKRRSCMARYSRGFEFNPLKYMGVIKSKGPRHYEYDLVGGTKRRKKTKHKKNVWEGHHRAHRIAALKGWRHRMSNPRRRRHSSYSFFNNAWFDDAKGHRRAAKKGWRIGHLRQRKNNPVSYRHRRRYRRNPVDFKRFTSGIMNVKSWAPLAVVGGLSAITGAVTPGLFGLSNPWAKYGTQLVVAFGGGVLLEGTVGRNYGEAWMIVGVSMVGYNLLKQYVLVPYFPQFAVGLGEGYEHYYSSQEPYQQVGGSATGYGVSAFPGEVSAYPEDISAYPYDGHYGY